MSWLKNSNRNFHVLIGYLSALFGTIIAAAEVASALEGKDCQHDKTNIGLPPWKWNYKAWDWKDWWATMLGGLLGQITQIGIILLFIWLF